MWRINAILHQVTQASAAYFNACRHLLPLFEIQRRVARDTSLPTRNPPAKLSEVWKDSRFRARRQPCDRNGALENMTVTKPLRSWDVLVVMIRRLDEVA